MDTTVSTASFASHKHAPDDNVSSIASTEPSTQPEVKLNDNPAQSFPGGIVDARGCIVVMCVTEEADCYQWYVVPADKFHADVSRIAQARGYAGDCMKHYLLQADCVSASVNKPTDEANAFTALFEQWRTDLMSPRRYFVSRLLSVYKPECVLAVDLYE